jgi:hypothetical protein
MLCVAIYFTGSFPILETRMRLAFGKTMTTPFTQVKSSHLTSIPIPNSTSWILVLKESVRDIGTLPHPIGISSMNASFYTYHEMWSNLLATEGLPAVQPEWFLYKDP